MAYTTIDKPTDYFNTVLYTGNATARTITGVGFQPDWVWGKIRSEAQDHVLVDSVRGATKQLYSSDTSAEQTESQGLTGFASDGFTLGTHAYFNKNTATYVAWNWLAGGTASSNGDGSITSSVSANTTAGFSIVTYTGTGSAATVGHGLGAVPKMFWTKRIDSSESWGVYSDTQGAGKFLRLESTNAVDTSSTLWNNTTPTSSVFSIGTGGIANTSSGTYVAYCFAEKQGYSKFGSYTGNGNANGAFVYTGFRPAFVLLKVSSTTNNWNMFDDKRPGFNEIDQRLFPNLSSAEQDGTAGVDFLSNGFKFRNTNDNYNASGATYIYMAFAENPFVTAGTKAAGTAV
jgi:hypothetical protein